MPKILDFNKYVLTHDRDDADQIVVPFDVDGVPQRPIYLMNPNACDDITTPVGAVWEQGVRVSRKGTPSEYAALVDWWFDNASSEYKGGISKAFGSKIDVPSEIEKAKSWLKKLTKSGRKCKLDQFLFNWMNNASRRAGRFK